MTSKMMTASVAYKPFDYPWAVDLTVEHERMHWTEEEVDLADDVVDWRTGRLSTAEKNLITQILRMFTQSDVNVGAFYTDFLMPRFKNNQLRGMLRSFSNREDTHQRAYALLNDTLGLPESDYTAFLVYKEMADKHEFMLEADTSTSTGLALAMAKSVVNEGIGLFASFAILLNFQRFGRMRGMCKVVEWSTKDEGKHVEGVSRLFRTYCDEHPQIVTDTFKWAIYDMVRRAVDLEDSFVDRAFEMGEAVEGLDPVAVKSFIRYIADRRLVQLGLKANFSVGRNPLPWLDIVLNAPDHTNFFENKVAEYEVGSLVGAWEYPASAYDTAGGSIIVFGRIGCRFCDEAKAMLDRLGVAYGYRDLSDNAKRQHWYDANGFVGDQRAVPKIYVAGKLIGGCSELDLLMTG